LSEANTKTETKLVFLSGKSQVDSMWSKLLPFFQRAVDEAGNGEISVNSLKKLVDEGHSFLAYIKDENEILMALALEFKLYPDLRVLNVLMMAGKRMDELFACHHKEFTSFSRAFGIDSFEASGSRAMSRKLHSNGWEFVREVNRFNI